MDLSERTRRSFLKQFGAAGAAALAAANADGLGLAQSAQDSGPTARAHGRRPEAGRNARRAHGVVARG